MVNPGTFRGLRKAFLESQKDEYATGVQEERGLETLFTITRRYFKRFPIDLPLDEEPTEEFLAAVRDDEPDPEVLEPNPLGLTNEEYEEAKEKFEARRKLIIFRKGQLKRWFAYRYMKDHDLDPTDNAHFNPYRELVSKLTGKEAARPRLNTATNIWRRTHKEEIENRLRSVVAGKGIPKAQHACLRDKIAREMFGKLSDEERKQWSLLAKQEHDTNLAEWKKKLAGPPPTDPASRQRCIQGLVRFTQLILDLLADHTGWKVTLIAGGPEPAQGGLLNVISVHAGTTSGDIKLNFGMSERQRFKEVVVPIFGSFLKKCYSVSECRSRSLDLSEGHLPLNVLELESDTVLFDTIANESLSSEATDGAGSLSSVPLQPPPTSVPTLPPSQVPPPSLPSPTFPERELSSAGRSQVPPPSLPSPTFAQREPSSAGPSQLAPLTVATETLPTLPVGDKVMAPLSTPAVDLPILHSPVFPRVSPLPSRAPSPAPSLPHSPPPTPISRRALAPRQSTTANSASATDALPQLEAHIEAPVLPPADLENQVTGFIGKKRSLVLPPDEPPTDPSPKRSRPKKSFAHVHNPTATVRQRRNTNPVDISSPTRPSTNYGKPLEPYFTKALELFRSEDLDAPWKELVSTWIGFERKHGFTAPSGRRIPCQSRPLVLSEWIKSGRLSTFKAKILNASRFGHSFLQWWYFIQPAWRKGSHVSQIFI